MEQDNISALDCTPYATKSTTTWVHAQGTVTAETMQALGDIFDLHPLALEDVLNAGQRPKTDTFDESLFVVLALPLADQTRVAMGQVSIFLGKNYVLSFFDGPDDPFEPIRKRLRNRAKSVRARGADYLFYLLIDVVIDGGFPLLEAFAERLDQLEDEVLQTPGKETMQALHRAKSDLLLARRTLWPERDVINVILRGDHPLIGSETNIYLRDCYDHTIQIMDLIEVYREMLTSMIDVYLSNISYTLNDVMRTLTVIATIFIPLTFIVGIYGMNFGTNDESPWAMPELHWYYGYPLIWLIMTGVALGLLYFFRRKRWI